MGGSNLRRFEGVYFLFFLIIKSFQFCNYLEGKWYIDHQNNKKWKWLLYYVWIATIERKERKGWGRERREEKWKGRISCLFRIIGKGRERKGTRVFFSNLFNSGNIDTLTKNIHLIPLNSFQFCYPNKGSLVPPNPSPFFFSISFHPNTLLLLSFCSPIWMKLSFLFHDF